MLSYIYIYVTYVMLFYIYITFWADKPLFSRLPVAVKDPNLFAIFWLFFPPFFGDLHGSALQNPSRYSFWWGLDNREHQKDLREGTRRMRSGDLFPLLYPTV